MPLIGCSETAGDGGSGGTAGNGGAGGDVSCTGDEQCDDDNACTEHYCDDEERICVYEPIACDDDLNECTADTTCNPAVGCESPPVADGTPCDGGTCQAGACELSGSVLPCTENGIRNAVAAGGGPYTFDCNGPTAVVTGATITIDNDVILDGEGNLTVDGNLDPDISDSDHAAFFILGGVAAELRQLSVSNSLGIENQGSLTLENVSVTDNECRGGKVCTDGAINNDGTMTVTNCTVSGNAVGLAGAINNNGDGEMTVTNCTVSGNEGGFGAISNEGTMTVLSSTLSGNDENQAIQTDANLTMINTVVDGGCVGTITSNGYNIESPGDTCGFDPDGTDLVNVSADDLKLRPLADNGGPTMTHALGAGSVAIDVIPADMCEVTEDQRGFPRDSMCDVGAFEVQP